MKPAPREAASPSSPVTGGRHERVAHAGGLRHFKGRVHMLHHGVRSILWQRRAREPSWPEVWSSWERAVAEHRDLPAELHGHLAADDRVTLLTDNAASFRARQELHAGARRKIDLSTYYLQADDTGKATSDELLRAAHRGVRVRVVLDDFMARNKEFELGGLRALLDGLVRGGVELTLWRDPRRPFDSNHRKLLVVDDERCIIGGRNVADHYARSGWRDVELLLEGPGARAASAVFEETWTSKRVKAEGGELIQSTSPARLLDHPNVLFLLHLLRNAARTVDIENAYWVAHEPVVRAAAAAVRRGVRVRLFTNSAESTDLGFTNWRVYRGYQSLLEGGIELYVCRGAGRTLHSKYFVVDDAWVSLGSSNFDFYSPRFCLEANLQAYAPGLASELRGWFEKGLSEAGRVTDPSELQTELRRNLLSRGFDAVLRDLQ